MSAGGSQGVRLLDAQAPHGPLRAALGRPAPAVGRARRKVPRVYTITTSTKATRPRMESLARAVDRLKLPSGGVVESVEVVACEGRIQLSMRSASRRRRASRSARRLFAPVWYDAFGEHLDEGAPCLRTDPGA